MTRGKGRDREARLVLFAVPAVVDFSMEEICAKFVSQKISKTRWRPLPPGSLQTAETFATGSWDNEVPQFPGWGSPPLAARARNSSFMAPFVLVPSCGVPEPRTSLCFKLLPYHTS
jgi:hypothetical protein